MAKNIEIATITEMAALGMIPVPSEQERIQNRDPEFIVQEVFSGLDRRLNVQQTAEHTNHFGKWIRGPVEMAKGRIAEFVQSAVHDTRRRDASRILSAVLLNWYSPTPASRFSFLLDFVIVEETGLGDGAVLYTPDGWKPTQIKGSHLATKHCRVRQRK